MAFHSPGFDGDSTATMAALHPVTGFPHTPGTHFHSGFGHLFGYDAGYYGYLWSQVFGDDMYTAFAGEGGAEMGLRYRRKILEPGGSTDGAEMVRRFLGREPNNTAFLRGLGLKP
jgi:thimet oligopeptidase